MNLEIRSEPAIAIMKAASRAIAAKTLKIVGVLDAGAVIHRTIASMIRIAIAKGTALFLRMNARTKEVNFAGNSTPHVDIPTISAARTANTKALMSIISAT
ncbi:hypothetical protein [Billgrantia kenyensis]|uniref:Uncharacterized protein n=1 Tax=Billgrantia kenyensis TaxID=321266 RepID=A0A7V9W566_9GAMM|nr:hypothetical protein [Halomonas kenyensis]MBA2781231.1 hypothetical protein [Halomonas kenyensis]